MALTQGQLEFHLIDTAFDYSQDIVDLVCKYDQGDLTASELNVRLIKLTVLRGIVVRQCCGKVCDVDVESIVEETNTSCSPCDIPDLRATLILQENGCAIGREEGDVNDDNLGY